MSRHVILLTDAHEAPAYELIEALQLAGVKTLIEGLREPGSQPPVRRPKAENDDDIWLEMPVAILYEVVPGADMVELHAAIEQANTSWPDTPVIACRRQLSGYHGPSWRNLDGATLKRLGFRAIADKAAQLPAILHEVEGHGITGELKLPEITDSPTHNTPIRLPAHIKSTSLRAAFDLVASLHFIGDQASAAQTALAGLVPLVNADRWTIYLFSDTKGPDGSMLEPLASLDPADQNQTPNQDDWRSLLLREESLPVGMESRAARLAGTGMGTIKKKERGQNYVAVPLVCGERILGVLEGIRQERSFSRADAALLDALSFPVASALANAVRIGEAERLSQTDDLTKLHNARYLRQFLLNEIRRARRYGSSVAALFLDLDNFKHVNDAHGHLAGSHVLMEMAAVILSSIRDTDAVARYGGDEFVIVLPDTQIELAGTVAQRIRSKISQYQFNAGRNLKLSLTASFGVAAFPLHASSPQQLIAAADTAMYEAKAANKNCIRFATAPPRDNTETTGVTTQADLSQTDDRKVFS
jgi:diguanylate cyclase (GGDEF)-like protein